MGFLLKYRSTAISTAILVSYAIFSDMLVYGILIPTLPPLSKKHQIQPSQLGLVLSSYSVGIVVTPVVAILSDTYSNRKIPIISGSILLGLSCLCFAFGNSLLWFVLGRMGQGIAGGVGWMIGFSMLAESFPTNLGLIMGNVMTANTFGNLFGPPIGGMVFDYFGPIAPLYLCIVVCMLDTFVRIGLKKPIWTWNYVNTTVEQDDDNPIAEESPLLLQNNNPAISVGLWKLLSSYQMLITLLAIVIGEAVLTGIEPTLPLYLHDKFDQPPTFVGIIWTAISIPKLLACSYSGLLSDSFGRKKTTCVGLIIFAIACLILGTLKSIWSIVSLLCLFGIGAGISLTPGVPEMADLARMYGDTSFGTVYSLYNIASSLGMMLGPIIGSWIYSLYGFPAQLYAFGGSLVLMAIIVFISIIPTKKSFEEGSEITNSDMAD